VAGVVALIAFFNAHDSSTTSANGGGGPGQVDTTSSATVLRAGNVILEYSDRTDLAPLRAVARAETGTDSADSSLVTAGQAVIIGRVAHGTGVTARAYHRTLHAPNGKDPAVEDFVSAYLGQGAQ
jgi:hypothetical protein